METTSKDGYVLVALHSPKSPNFINSRSHMKITRVNAVASSQRRDKPIRDALQSLDTRGTCEISVETDEGVRGTGSIYFGRVEKAPHTLAYLVNEVLGPEIIGQDPFMVRGIRDQLWKL